MKYFDEPFMTVHWVADGNIVWAEWKQPVVRAQAIQGLDAGLELLIQKKSSRWLADTRLFQAADPLDVQWVNDNWVPRAVDGGVRWMATVIPKKVISQLQVSSFLSRINDRELATAFFESVDEAATWLRAQS